MPSPKSRIGAVLSQEDGLQVRESYLRIDPRVDIYVKEKWLPDADDRLPVVLLHGAGMDGAGWDVPVEGASLIDALALHGSRTFALDFRGHGRSSRVVDGKTVTVATSVDDTLAVLDHVREITGRPKAILVGESFGSMVAPYVAARVPERIAGLALLGLVYRQRDEPIDEGFAAMLAVLRQEPAGYAFTTEEEWPDLFIPSASPAVTAWHQAHFGTAYAYPVGPYLGVGAPSIAPDLSAIGGRVLVVTGDLDPYARVPNTEAFLAAVGTRQTRHVQQRGVGHLPYVEKDLQAVQQAIAELIDEATADWRHEQ
ncbi:MAG TPA: alpha/beta fold hydrolase [Chloroflexota bacterium]|jgi:pimeloyl-ACP methyl ester carboxylesterase|nr:alpha/beta fold hydrolase [Chloroflexota bacterium]